jgi:hypothetical protein
VSSACFALAFWNARDLILKERIFGLSGAEGNHGEDAKEYWWYLDATPTASWLSWRHHHPQAEFPYARLREENARRTRDDPEFELLDTGIFDGDRYWQITADYAKAVPRESRSGLYWRQLKLASAGLVSVEFPRHRVAETPSQLLWRYPDGRVADRIGQEGYSGSSRR